MSVENYLDKLIRKVEKAEASVKAKANSSTQKVVVIDKRTREVIQKIPLWGGNIAYYLVSNTSDASNFAERRDLPIEVTDFANDRKLNISVSYRASCGPGSEEKVAKALHGDNSPGIELDKKIEKWVAELTRDRAAEFIDNYFIKVAELQKFLQAKAKNEIYINLDVRLTLTKENQLETIKIGPTEITVYVSDSDNPLNLQLQTELIVSDKVRAISSLGSGWLLSLVKVTKEEIKQYFLEKVTISQFYYELKDTVRNGLFTHLNEVLVSRGRRVGYLYLDSKASSSPPVSKELIEIQYTVKCNVQKYSGLISVENTLQMLPQDVRRYISAQSPNLQAWVENKLEKIIKPLLLDKKYVEILLDFQKESEAIRRAMLAEAESIGYAVKHIVSLPKLEHLKLKENLEIKDNTTEFSTNAANIKVQLSTAVNIRFERFDKIEDYLSLTINEIKELIRETVNSTTREILRKTLPERFYMRFYETETLEEKSVEQELKDGIKAALENRFGTKVNSIVPIPQQTDIIDYLQRLMGMIGSFECEIPALTGRETVKFQGDFKILSIEKASWSTFQSVFQSMQQSQQQLRQELKALKYQYSNIIDLGDIEDNRDELQEISERIRFVENEVSGITEIKKSIEKSINTKLITADSKFLTYTDLQLLSTIERLVSQWARDSVVEQYGLEISIQNLSRTRTKQEEYLYKAQEDLEKAKVDESLAQLEARREQRKKQLEMSLRRNQAKYLELDKLCEQRLKLIADPDIDRDELKHLDEQISQLEKELPNFSLEEAGSNLNLLKPERSTSIYSLELEKQMSLPSSQTNPDSTSSRDTGIHHQDDENIK